MADGDLKVQTVSPTEVANNNAVVFIGWPKYANCEFTKVSIGDLYMLPMASKVTTPHKGVTDVTHVVNSIDAKTVTLGRERSVEITTKKLLTSEAYKKVLQKIIDGGLTHPDDLVYITVITGYEYSCQNPDDNTNVRVATGKVYTQSYVASIDWDNSWYSGEMNKLVEQNFKFPTYTQMISDEVQLPPAFAQAVLEGQYPYGNKAVYDHSKTGMAKFVSTK